MGAKLAIDLWPLRAKGLTSRTEKSNDKFSKKILLGNKTK